jgi:hypothetical protein
MMMGLMGLEILGETVMTILVSMTTTTGLTKRKRMKQHQSNTQRLLPMPNRVEKSVLVVETPCEVVRLMGQVAPLLVDVVVYLAAKVSIVMIC